MLIRFDGPHDKSGGCGEIPYAKEQGIRENSEFPQRIRECPMSTGDTPSSFAKVGRD